MQLKSMLQQNQENGITNMRFNKIKLIITLGILGLVLAGCGGGGSSSGTAADAGSAVASANVVEGVLVDSPVAGVNYQTETHEGITDENGRFICFEDEMVQFMIGDVILGQAMAGEMITLMDFLDDAAMPDDITNPMVTNMGRFLQSLDADGDPENGITITQDMRDEISGRMIDFHQSVEDFEIDPDVLACFDTLNGLNMPHFGMMWGLVSTDDALTHMAAHMGYTDEDGDGIMDGNMGDRMDEMMDDYMGLTDDEDDDGTNPMDGYMDDEMIDYMNDHMGFTDDNGDGIMDGDMGDRMDEMMDDYMGFTDDEDDGGTGPMDGYMDDEMADHMNDQMGFTDDDEDGSGSNTSPGSMMSGTSGMMGSGSGMGNQM